MTLVINKSGSWFETENCDFQLNSLCCKYLCHFSSRSFYRTVSNNLSSNADVNTGKSAIGLLDFDVTTTKSIFEKKTDLFSVFLDQLNLSIMKNIFHIERFMDENI